MKERNQTFNYLYVLAIFMVIDDHVSSRIGLLSTIFPYNSFYMPLFIFCSGYFYKKSTILKNIAHKAKKLLVPYFIWNIIGIIVAHFIDKTFNMNWCNYFNLKGLLIWIFKEPTTSINGASWFISLLFWVSVIYNIIRNFVKLNKKNDTILSIIFTILGFASLFLCLRKFYQKNEIWLFVLKISFYIQFYNLRISF